MLASDIPDAQSFLQFWLIISMLVSTASGATAVAAFFNSRRVQKREVSFTREYASREELLHVLKDLERIECGLAEVRVEMKQDRQLIMAAADARMEKITARVDKLIEGVGRLQDRIA